MDHILDLKKTLKVAFNVISKILTLGWHYTKRNQWVLGKFVCGYGLAD